MKKLATVGLASLLALGAVTTYVNAEEVYQGNDFDVKAQLDAANQEAAAKEAAAKAAAEKAAAEKAAEKAAEEKFLSENGLSKDGSTFVGEEKAPMTDKEKEEKYNVKLQGLDQKMPGEQGSIAKPEVKEEAKKAEKAATETKAAATAKAPAKATKALPKTSAVK